jgi:uncharacterized membrane protein YbhN (UPF0104 family)
VTETTSLPGRSRARRLAEVGAWLIGAAAVVGILQLAGVDVTGWFSKLWDEISHVPAGYIVAGLVLQTGQTCFAGLAYYGILSAAYPGEVRLSPIITAYAVGVAMNNFLPANIGTFVTLLMFVTIIPTASLGGTFASYLVQKIFFMVVGVLVYVYLFVSVPGSFDANLGNISAHPAIAVAIVAAAIFLVALIARVFWRQVKKLWAQAKRGGAILAQPRRYLARVFMPALLSYACKYAVIGIFLAAFAIPVTFKSVTWVVGSGSLANVVSFTPGSVGITQATNALALDVCCNVPKDTVVAYSTAQQLITTAWNVLFATLLVVLVFGWSGGRELVSTSYADAKKQVAGRRKRHDADSDDGRARLRNELSGRAASHARTVGRARSR